MSLVEINYNFKCNQKSDINEHLPTLCELARECDSVIELGVRGVVSSWAFAMGLPEGSRMFMNDLEPCNATPLIRAAKNEKNIDATFVKGSDLEIDLPEKADLVFIDTWHIYGQLKRELARYEPLAKKYIVMHDTTVDEWEGETIRLGWNAEEQSKQTGWPVEEITKGLWPAVDEFLRKNEGKWELKKRYFNNNGLTILKRV
jgi:hypothetical protein